jgi:hypothetical protein
MGKNSVRCMVRLRPLSNKEKEEGASPCINAFARTVEARDSTFTYDYVFPCNVEQVNTTSRQKVYILNLWSRVFFPAFFLMAFLEASVYQNESEYF